MMENEIMDVLELVEPTSIHRDQVMTFRQEHMEIGEYVFHGDGSLDDTDDFDMWLTQVQRKSHRETVGEGRVTATQYLCIRKADGRLVGLVNIRHELNELLLREGGHIGYMVHIDERRKGYATGMLALALDKCRRLGIDRVLVVCDRDNIASAKTIRNNGGVLENEIMGGDGAVVQRYWIDLKNSFQPVRFAR